MGDEGSTIESVEVGMRSEVLNGGVKRSVIESIGLFDEERFAAGYCEENDYSYRAYKRGYHLGVATDGAMAPGGRDPSRGMTPTPGSKEAAARASRAVRSPCRRA